MTEFRLEELTEQPTAVIRDRIPMDQLKSFFDNVYGTVMAALGKQGAQPVGPPFAKYTGMPSDTVDVEAGFPVEAGFTEGDGVSASTLPGGRVAAGTHLGPYEGLSETYQSMAAWIQGQGFAPGQAVWEVYMSDPGQEPDASTWRTDVYWPVVETGAGSARERP